jgi:serine/threonine protein kinase
VRANECEQSNYFGVAWCRVLSPQTLHKLCNPALYGLRHGTPEFELAASELLQEARLLQSLRHPNIVAMHGVTMHPEHGHVQWLVTERADGGSLKAWLSARGVLTPAELLDLLCSVMRALAYLHSRTPSVIHGDIKPANVLAFNTPDGGIVFKLGDFGSSKELDDTGFTREGVGTPFYAAPEVYRGRYDGKVDVYSTGIIAAELVLRHTDIDGFERLTKRACNKLQPEALVAAACARLDAVSPSLSLLVSRVAALAPEDRVSSDAALAALEARSAVSGCASSLPARCRAELSVALCRCQRRVRRVMSCVSQAGTVPNVRARRLALPVHDTARALDPAATHGHTCSLPAPVDLTSSPRQCHCSCSVSCGGCSRAPLCCWVRLWIVTAVVVIAMVCLTA